MSEEIRNVIESIGDRVSEVLAVAGPQLPALAVPARSVHVPTSEGHQAGHLMAGAAPAMLGWDLLKPFAARLAPVVIRAVFAGLAEKYGPAIRDFLAQHGAKVREVVGDDAWAKVEALLRLFLPESVAPVVDPNIRPIFGATFPTS